MAEIILFQMSSNVGIPVELATWERDVVPRGEFARLDGPLPDLEALVRTRTKRCDEHRVVGHV